MPELSPQPPIMMNGRSSGSTRSASAGGDQRRSQRVTILLPTALIERLRNAVYWTGRHTLAQLITDAVEDLVHELEQPNGGAFPVRLSPLKRGRPVRKRVPAHAVGSRH